MNESTPTDRLHPAALPEDRLLADCEIRFTRRSGPGGQNRNKVETAVLLSHRPSGLSAEASERRHQGQNKEVALDRLRRNLALEVRRPVGPEGTPSLLWRSRCSAGRLRINPDHPDFPAPVAELARGKIYTSASIDLFNQRWERKRTGRPPKNPA